MIAPLVRDRDRSIRIRRQARRLADSGAHSGWESIESALLFRDGDWARKALGSKWARFSLNVRCAFAKLMTRSSLSGR